MKKSKERHCRSSLGFQGCRRPPSGLEKLDIVGRGANTAAEVNGNIVNPVRCEHDEIFMASLAEGTYLTLYMS